MSDSPKDARSSVQPAREGSGERLVYVMPEQVFGTSENEISLRDLWDTLWRGKWIIIVITAAFAVGSVLFALASEEWYRAETLLAPADERTTPALGGQLGGLAALAGVNVGSGDASEAIATLKSRELAREFIQDNRLIIEFFAEEWDAEQATWIIEDPSDWPDIRSAIKYFHDNIFKVSQDRQTGLVTLAIEWKDPDVAAMWATDLVQRVNETLRMRALREAEANVDYLQAELSRTTLLALQQSVGRLLESELQRLMVARGNEEFAFKIIDPASSPRERVRPKRALISVVGTMIGGVFGVFLVLFLRVARGDGTNK